MSKQFWAEVVTNEQVRKNFWWMTIQNEELARAAKPGQFLHIKVSNLTPLLRRPISIHDVEGDKVKILYQVVGEGTRLLTNFKQGETIDVMGPLGNGFNLDGFAETKSLPKVAIVAGGIGVAPLLYLVKSLSKKGIKVTLYQGAGTNELLLGQEFFTKMNLEYKIATDDGSAGHKGFVTELLARDLHKESFTQIYSCGPHVMLQAVANLALKYDVPAQLSLEERMGCGTGACLACVCKIKTKANELGEFTYKKVCLDGPVFAAKEVVFDD